MSVTGPAEGATFARAVLGSLADTLDRDDRARIARDGLGAAVRLYVEPDADFVSRPEWWRLAYDHEDRLVGFAQPVLFRGCARDGLEEGTIHYIGVLPEFRGRQYIDDVLLDATATLQGIGVWRISCDTDVENRPMIAAFERCGYERYGIRELAID